VDNAGNVLARIAQNEEAKAQTIHQAQEALGKSITIVEFDADSPFKDPCKDNPQIDMTYAQQMEAMKAGNRLTVQPHDSRQVSLLRELETLLKSEKIPTNVMESLFTKESINTKSLNNFLLQLSPEEVDTIYSYFNSFGSGENPTTELKKFNFGNIISLVNQTTREEEEGICHKWDTHLLTPKQIQEFSLFIKKLRTLWHK